MSLGIVIKGPEGLVLAADSRMIITATLPGAQSVTASYDNATKLLSFDGHKHVAAVTYGQAVIGLRTAHGFLPEFEANLGAQRVSVQEFAQQLSDFFARQWAQEMPRDYGGPDMALVVAGFDEGKPYGTCFVIEIPRHPQPVERNPGQDFGITWGGQREFVDRLLQGFDSRLLAVLSDALQLSPERIRELELILKKHFTMPLPIQAMALQDCVDLAVLFLRTTIDVLKLTAGVRGVGGSIDVATITRSDGIRFVQRKQISVEARREG